METLRGLRLFIGKFNKEKLMYGVTENIANGSASSNTDRICKMMLLEEVFPKWHLDECDKTGEMPSVKVGGISWKAAILATMEDNGTWTPNSSEDVEIVELQFPTPRRVYDKNIGLTHVIKVGKGKGNEVMFGDGGDKVIVDTIMPSTFPAKDFKSGIQADKIPQGMENKYADLIEQETKRVRIWENILRYWDDISEDGARHDTNIYISKRLLLYGDNGSGIKEYVLPQSGMVFTTKLKGKYNEPIAFEWSKEKNSFLYYSKGIETIDVAAASRLLTATVDEEMPF